MTRPQPLRITEAEAKTMATILGGTAEAIDGGYVIVISGDPTPDGRFKFVCTGHHTVLFGRASQWQHVWSLNSGAVLFLPSESKPMAKPQPRVLQPA